MQKTVASGKYVNPVDSPLFNSEYLHKLRILAWQEGTTYQSQLHSALYLYLRANNILVAAPEFEPMKKNTRKPSPPKSKTVKWSPRLPREYIEGLKRISQYMGINKSEAYNNAIFAYLQKRIN